MKISFYLKEIFAFFLSIFSIVSIDAITSLSLLFLFVLTNENLQARPFYLPKKWTNAHLLLSNKKEKDIQVKKNKINVTFCF